jgi:hypothetical protein
MIMKKTSIALAASLLAIIAAPAFAQDAAPSGPDRIVLESKAGSVMTSTGGAFETAAPGKPLVAGESMMLTEGANATVAYYYDNGERKCVEQYAGPNTYVIDDRCVKAGGADNGTAGKSALIVVGAGLIGAAVLESMDKVPPGPLSAGAR